MRSMALIVVTALVLVGTFLGYWHWSAALTPSELPAITTRPVRNEQSGGAQGSWVKMYDKQTGRLTQQFRAERFDPRGGGLYHAIRPEAEFFFNSGPSSGASSTTQPSSPQVVRIVGVEGNVNTVTGQTDPTLGRPVPTSLSRGLLQDVTITMYPDAIAAARDQPDMTFTMANLEFDNDTFRIYTPGDEHTAPDRVEVHGHGDDADFFGEGMEIRWDELGHRLLSLEIAHGHYLTVKNAAALGMSSDNPQSTTSGAAKGAAAAPGISPVAPPSAPANPAAPSPNRSDVVLGGNDHPAAGASPAPPTNQLYRADFYDNVRVIQNDVEKITADVMHVDFVSGAATQPSIHSNEITSHGVAANNPGGAPVVPPAPPANDAAPIVAGSGQPGAPSPVGSSNVSPGLADPATGPVTVQWSGLLRMAPLDGESSGPRPAPGKGIVRLDGNPVRVHDGLGQVAGARVTYWGNDQSALAEGTAAAPVELTDTTPDGSAVIDATWMRFGVASSGGTARAVTLGPGKAKLRSKPTSPGAAEQVVDARWSKQVTVSLVPQPDGKLALSRAELDGDVDVRESGGTHVSGETINLAFDPALATAATPKPPRANPSGAPVDFGGSAAATLTTALVKGNARCEMVDAQGVRRTIAASEIQMAMAHQDGRAYPRHVTADGAVVVTTPDGTLSAKQLESDLSPPVARGGATAGGGTNSPRAPAGAINARLDHLDASGNVKLTGQNGIVATGDELKVDTTDRGQTMILSGAPASATDGVSTLTGPSITMIPGEQQATVSGAGELVTTTSAGSAMMAGSTSLATGGSATLPTQRGASPTSRPVTITWKQDATLLGRDNVIDVNGSVDLKTRGDDGSDQEASADHISLTLADKAPATAPAKKPAAAADAPDPLNVASMSFMSNKQVTAVRLTGSAKVQSLLSGPDGSALRTQSLTADEIDSDLLARTVTVPGPGELDVTEIGEAKTPTTSGSAPALPGSGNGLTGIGWKTRLVYDMAKGMATFDGPLKIVHLDNAKPRVETDMFANQMVATFGAGADAAGGAQQLKSMTAGGDVTVTTRGYVIKGGAMQYDPIAQYLIVKGTDEWPGAIRNTDGTRNNSFGVLELDQQTGDVKITGGMNGQIVPGH